MPIEIRMPRLADSMTQGTVIAWRVGVGQHVRAGDVLAELEVDKATVDLPAPAAGRLVRIIVSAGTEQVEVGRVLAVLDETSQTAPPETLESAAVGSPSAPKANGNHIDKSMRIAESLATSEGPTSAGEGHPSAGSAAPVQTSQADRDASPLARSMARQAGLDLGSILGSGPGGRVVVKDLSAARGLIPAARPIPATRSSEGPDTAAATEPAPYSEVPHSAVRRVTAERLGASKRSIPHFYLEVQCQIDALLRVRSEIAARQDGGMKLSITDFAVRATALALRAVPDANASWTDGTLRRFQRVDLAVAVATDAGLVAPVLRDVDHKGLLDLSRELRALAQKAREGRLRVDELQGGTFTISNLGMYGVDVLYPIINPPQAGILGLGAAVARPVARDGAVVVANVMACTLAADHRVLDGAAGARLLTAFRDFMEQPLTMML